MQKLRKCGIYKLPDGREFVALMGGKGDYLLCDVEIYWKHRMPEYVVHTDGRLFSKGAPTKWTADDLEDTGRTALTP